MALLTHVASHPDQLVSRLCEELASPLDDAFVSEVIAVPTRGIERWLTQRIALDFAQRGIGDGICANIEFPLPWRLINQVLLEVPDLRASVDAWHGPALRGQVVGAIDANLGEPWMRLLVRYLDSFGVGGDPSNANRLSAADKIARLFSGYARRRPDMIRAWVGGDDVGPDGGPLDDVALWQPKLWRSLRAQIGQPALPELMPSGLDSIRDGSVELDLPDRLAVYGLTATDPFDLEVLDALSAHRDIHVYVLHPSPALWTATGEHLASNSHPGGRIVRDDDTTEELAAHPLLKSWARDSRELQPLLAGHGLGEASVVGLEVEGDSATVLAHLQADIRANREPALVPALAEVAGADRSLQIHACHGAGRQVEVMRDAILHALVADPTLEPRDVVIMTPDLPVFALLLEASFPSGDAGSSEGLPDLRLRIADRSPSAVNPLIQFTSTLISLANSRFEAGVIRELVGLPVVQECFGFDPATAGEIVGVIDDANIAWGLDGFDRVAFGAGTNEERSWNRGLDRALAGVFYSDDGARVVDTTAPMDGMEGQDATPAGLLAQIIDRITSIRAAFEESRPMWEWAAVISSSVRLLAAPAWDDEWQWDQLERLLSEAFPTPEPDSASDDSVVSLAEARVMVAGWIDDRPSPLHFRTGDVTVCTFAPMRSVPYRVVCLLGVDDQRFPRRGSADGDDLLLGHELVGDYDRASEDRQLLLDAVMVAEQHLIVTYSGRDELTNSDLPPAVPIAELQDTLREMVGYEGHEQLVTTHPLQAFSEDNFTPAALGVAGPWAFDPMQFDAAAALQERPADSPQAAVSWPDTDDVDPVALDDLIGFLQGPAQRFVRSRLGFTIPELEETSDDTLPTSLEGLEAWAVKNRLLSGLDDGDSLNELIARQIASDALSPGDLGTADLEDAVDAVSILISAAEERGYEPGNHAPVFGLANVGGRSLEGSVSADRGRAHLMTVTPSRLKGKQRLRTFVELAFVSLMEPEAEWIAVLIGRASSGPKHLAVTFGPIGNDPAERRQLSADLLADFIDLYDEGHRLPLPIPCETAYQWQSKLDGGRSKAFGAADKEWDGFNSSERGPAHELVLPELESIGSLLDAGLTTYADRLWGPILPFLVEEKL